MTTSPDNLPNAANQPITSIVGIDDAAASKLKRAGISTVSQMWANGGDRTGRTALAGVTGINAERLKDWATKADLMRIPRITPAAAVLLMGAGVTSLRQLGRRGAEPLRTSLIKANRTIKALDEIPPEEELARWIDEANGLSP